MAWTDYSSTQSNSWDSAIGTAAYDTGISLRDVGEESFPRIMMNASSQRAGYINTLSESYNIPGFDDGYQPEGVSNPIEGDLGGGSGGGGSTRPASGMLYPRGQG